MRVCRLHPDDLFADNQYVRIESWAHSHIGLVRKSNQDSLAIYPDLGLFILADGMGGHAAGEVASRLAVQAIYDNLRHAGFGGTESSSLGGRMARFFGRASEPLDTELALRTALQHANQTIVQAGASATVGTPGSERSMGSTAVVLAISPATARACWAHVGDSRLYRLRADALILLTADDTVPGDRYRGQTDVPTDLPHTNVLLQALGTQPDVDVAVGSASMDSGDLFLLCSDGVSGMVDAVFIQDTLRQATALEDAGQKLIRGALDGGGRDNASLILIRVVED